MPAPAPESNARPTKAVVCLFAYARDKVLSGTLELSTPDGVTATVVFDDGAVTKVRTSAQVVYLANVLYELGYITPDALTSSLFELAKREKLHGQILLERGHITHGQLVTALHEQTARKIAHVLGMGEVGFEFEQDVDALRTYGGKESVAVEPLPAIWRSICETPPLQHLRDSLERVGTLPCRLVSGEATALFRFDREHLGLIDCMRVKEMSLDDLCAMQILSRERTALLFYCLLITKQIEGGIAAASSHAPPPSRPSQRSWTWRGPASALPQPPSSSTRPTASNRPSSSNPSASNSSIPNPPVIPRLPPLPVTGPRGVFERSRTILREDYYRRLRLTRAAGEEAVRDAYEREVRAWSLPAPPEIDGAQEAQDTILTALMEAHDTLTDADSRDEYLRLLSAHDPG